VSSIYIIYELSLSYLRAHIIVNSSSLLREVSARAIRINGLRTVLVRPATTLVSSSRSTAAGVLAPSATWGPLVARNAFHDGLGHSDSPLSDLTWCSEPGLVCVGLKSLEMKSSF